MSGGALPGTARGAAGGGAGSSTKGARCPPLRRPPSVTKHPRRKAGEPGQTRCDVGRNWHGHGQGLQGRSALRRPMLPSYAGASWGEHNPRAGAGRKRVQGAGAGERGAAPPLPPPPPGASPGPAQQHPSSPVSVLPGVGPLVDDEMQHGWGIGCEMGAWRLTAAGAFLGAAAALGDG